MRTFLAMVLLELHGPKRALCWDEEYTTPYNNNGHSVPPFCVLPVHTWNAMMIRYLLTIGYNRREG